MSNLKQYMGIVVSSTNAPHDTFQRNTPRAASFNVCLFKHALGFALIWAISATSTAFAGDVTTSTNDTGAVEAVEPGTPIPLKLSKPLMSPSGAAPSTEPVQINFGASIGSVKPSAVVIEKVTSSGDKILEETVLRDDGNKPDAIAGDGFYSGALDLGIQNEETEIYFRLRSKYDSENHEKTVTSDIALFPITTIPLGSSPSAGSLIYSANYRADFFVGEVVVEPISGVTPRYFRDIIVKEAHDKSGSDLGSFRIVGYIPPLNVYLVAFGGEKYKTFQAIKRVTHSFKDSEKIRDAWPNSKSTPAALPWYLNKDPGIGGEEILANYPTSRGKDVGVAIIDRKINCNGIGNSCKFLPPTSKDHCKQHSYNYPGSSNPPKHGTAVAKLIAGVSTNVADWAGVALQATLYPIQLNNDAAFDTSSAISCVSSVSAHIGRGIHIINISQAVPTSTDLKTAVCEAVCADQLIVASAGNGGNNCTVEVPAFPARYTRTLHNKPPCPCNRTMRSGVLSVGGTDEKGNIGNDPVSKKCSFTGVIQAPGWNIPVVGIPNVSSFGTSWSTALVSGCAAVVAAAQFEKQPPRWNPSGLRRHLKDHSVGQLRLLDCFSAVSHRDNNSAPQPYPGPDPDEP